MKAAGDNCGNCRFINKEETPADQPAQFTCRRFPPQVSLMMMKGPATPANPSGVIPVPVGSFPPIQTGFICGEWQAKTLAET